MNRTLVIVAEHAQRLLAEQHERLERLRDEGFDVQIATPHSQALDSLAGLGFDTRPLPGADRWNLPGRVAAFPILQGEWLTNRPLLVHGYESPWAYVAALAAHRAGVPAVFVTKSSHDFAHRARRRAYAKLGHWATNYIVHHEGDLRELARLVPGPKLDLLLGGRGTDLTAFNPDDENLAPIARPPGRVVVAARRTTELPVLRQAVARRNPGVGWLLHDDAPTPSMLASADLYVQTDPSDHDGVDIMAAAAMTLPAIAADCVAARTTIVDHETGRIASPATLAETLLEVIDNPKRARDMGIRARARAESRFDRRHIDEQLLTIYDRALSERV